MPERREPRERLDPVRKLLDREERPGEEEERHEHEPEDRDEPLVAVRPRADGGEPRGEREAAEEARERSERGERGGERAADRRHEHEQRAGDDHPDARPDEDAGDELTDADRRGDDRVVRPEPLDARP